MELPRDPYILFSVVNTKLRDRYASLDALCEDLSADRAAIEETLAKIGYAYSPSLNQFIRK